MIEEETRECSILVATEDEFQVKEKSIHYTINMPRRSSDCGVWDLTGIFCKHGVLGIL